MKFIYFFNDIIDLIELEMLISCNIRKEGNLVIFE